MTGDGTPEPKPAEVPEAASTAPAIDPTSPEAVQPARTAAERRAQNRAAWRASRGSGWKQLLEDRPPKPAPEPEEVEEAEEEGSATGPTAHPPAGADTHAPDPATADGRADLASEAVAVLRAIMHAPPKVATNLDRIGAARELLALAGYRRAAPTVKSEAIPFTSMLARPSDGESRGRTDATPSAATAPASSGAPLGENRSQTDQSTGGSTPKIAKESDDHASPTSEPSKA